MTETDSKPARHPRLRALLFLLLSLAFGAALLIAMTWFVIGSAPRSQAVAMAEGVRVYEFAALPDDEAYPAAIAIAADGSLFSGSYQTGALWSISPAGEVSGIPGSRERIGAVAGLDIAPDGALYILDRVAPLEAAGAVVWRYGDGELASLFEIAYEAFDGGLLPDDIAVDSENRVYISDRLGHVLRFGQNGEPLGRDGGAIWWAAPCRDDCEITGLAYDRAADAILAADPAREDIYRLPISEGEPGASESLLREPGGGADYGFDGLAIAPNGDVYIALLNWNRVARVDDGALVMLAKDFRGASDLAFDAARNRLYVTNWNQFSLAFGTSPQLPFAIDAVELGAAPD